MTATDSHADTDRTLLEEVVAKAKAQGADAADAILVRGWSLSQELRHGQTDRLQRAEGQDLGLRVLIGQRQAMVSTTDIGSDALRALVERAVSMAKAVPEDPYCGLAAPDQLAETRPELDLLDPEEPAPETLIERARLCEESALAVSGVTNSDGAAAAWGSSRATLVASNGFSGSYASSNHAVSCSVLAGEGLKMEGDYDYSTTVFGADLEDPAEVGRRAGERAVKRLNPRRPKTGRYPVVFDPRISGGLLRSLAGAINGAAVARGTSFLKDKLGERLFPEGIVIYDDPHRSRGLRSRPFDAEGLATKPRRLIDDGVLTTWLLDLATARQLGLQSTGHAARGVSGPPSPAVTNLYMAPGQISRQALLADIQEGFYVTELMGQGVNPVTGDYSRGAAGFWIEGGELAYPVSEATIAGNLKEMFARITPADDLVFRTSVDAPTLRIDGTTVAGN
ncbi:TldD/PmbA family protein [Algihabitans sp.]|uniref:TldD/PmbA family protein n=1 Tax=Algihabitans sp. TaxID=2821514 RepID=UPI003BAC162B